MSFVPLLRALAGAYQQWRFCVAGGEVNWDLRAPADFERIGGLIEPERMRRELLVSSDLGRHAGWLAELAELGFAEIHLHQVGTNQEEFIDAFGAHVLPQLR